MPFIFFVHFLSADFAMLFGTLVALEKHFGAVKADDGTDFFVTKLELKDQTVRPGDRVVFEASIAPEGNNARNVVGVSFVAATQVFSLSLSLSLSLALSLSLRIKLAIKECLHFHWKHFS